MAENKPISLEQSSKPRKKQDFARRYYPGLKPFLSDLRWLLSRRDQIQEAMRSDRLPADFRERLMLAVTEVNQCRYCRTFHVGQARQAGISTQEITQYLKGNIPEDVPAYQKLALCYAQHWAETDADPDPEIESELLDVYGEQLARAINISLRMIRMGNLLGNTADYLLYRLSFGRWGGAARQGLPVRESVP
jgi:AhpD family alkylhydroperoxidase